MSAASVNTVLIAAGSLGLALVIRLVAAPLVRVGVPARAVIASSAAASGTPAVPPDSLTAAITAHDPFRVARRPAAAVYDPTPAAQPPTPVPPKPTLVLVGIVWDGGRDPAALVEGLPAADGPRSVRRGETIGGLRVTRIVANQVVITGLDTTWTLTVREPWR